MRKGLSSACMFLEIDNADRKRYKCSVKYLQTPFFVNLFIILARLERSNGLNPAHPFAPSNGETKNKQANNDTFSQFYQTINKDGTKIQSKKIQPVRYRKSLSKNTKKNSSRLTLYVSRQLDMDQFQRQRLHCSWTSSLELSADGPQTSRLVIQPLQTVVEDILNLVIGTTAQCESV